MEGRLQRVHVTMRLPAKQIARIDRIVEIRRVSDCRASRTEIVEQLLEEALRGVCEVRSAS